MKIIGITGSIGCGKTTIATQARYLGYVVFDVDFWVNRQYYQNSFKQEIKKLFPQAFVGNKINKKTIRDIVFNCPEKLHKLEQISEPFVKKALQKKIKASINKTEYLFVDMALLYELKWDKYCDKVIAADLDNKNQKQRVMKRDNISAKEFDKINKIQIKNTDKTEMADFVINTKGSEKQIKLDLLNILNGIS